MVGKLENRWHSPKIVGGTFLSGTYVYGLLVGGREVQILNVSDPSHPVLVSSFSLPHGTIGNHLFLGRFYLGHGQNLYVGTNTGVLVYDLSNPESPSRPPIGNYSTPGEVNWVTAEGQDIFVSGNFSQGFPSTLGIYQVLDPKTWKWVGCALAPGLNAISVFDRYIHGAAGENGLYIFDRFLHEQKPPAAP